MPAPPPQRHGLTADWTSIRARRAVGAVTALLLLVVSATYLLGEGNPAVADLGLTAVAMLAALNCGLAAAAARGRLRLAWAGLSGATLSWGIGEVVWSSYEVVLQMPGPFPGLSDLGYLGFPVGAVLALTVFPANVDLAYLRRMILDGLTTVCAIGLISWGTALGAAVHAGGDTLLGTAVSVAYPASDIALLVICVLVLSRSRAHRLPLAFIATGLALMVMADSGYAYLVATNSYTSGSNPIDLAWFFAFGVLAFAPLTRGATGEDTEIKAPTVAGTLLPYIPLAGAVAFLSWQAATDKEVSIVETSLGVMAGVLVLLRQFVTAHDNQRLAQALAVRELQLQHLAFHDQLTGLANRALFIDRMKHALALHSRDQRPLAICFLDLDGLKGVNDRLGHGVGDDLLRQASERFQSQLHGADTLARFGGDEFAVLLENAPDPVAVAQALLESLRPAFTLGSHQASVLASIGVATVDRLDPTPSVDELLMRADHAMYVVKRGSKAGVLLHTAGLELEEVKEVLVGRALASALADNELAVSFQPVIDLRTGRLDALEALARWAPDGQAVAPEVVNQAAESCNLSDSLFRFVLTEACDQLERWTTLSGGSRVRVALKITPGQLASVGFRQLIETELERHALSGDRLVLEITESGTLMDTAATQAVCRELRSLGVWLSVDDFRTGLSTLTQLRDLPINEIKVDRSFISNLDRDEARRRLVWGVIDFAERVGVTVVADGLEREGERDALTRLGCHRAQGFLFSGPVPAQDVDALLRTTGSWLPGIHTSPMSSTQSDIPSWSRD
jgi:diguanylate cyclase (GGDEF)-like protein